MTTASWAGGGDGALLRLAGPEAGKRAVLFLLLLALVGDGARGGRLDQLALVQGMGRRSLRVSATVTGSMFR